MATEVPDSVDLDDDETEQSIVEFIYNLNEDILDRQKEQSKDLNEKSAHLIRLLGVILSVYSGAFLIAARLTLDSSTDVNFDLFINEYVVFSIIFLAAGFLYAVLAYHKTGVASGASAQYLKNEFSEETTVEEAMRDINQNVPNWVSNNETEIEKDHTRLFNCKMCIFFSLSYLLVGTAFVGPISNFDTSVRVFGVLAVVAITYVLYDFVRGRASEAAS